MFEAARRLLSVGSEAKTSLIDRTELFFVEYSMMPLFVQVLRPITA